MIRLPPTPSGSPQATAIPANRRCPAGKKNRTAADDVEISASMGWNDPTFPPAMVATMRTLTATWSGEQAQLLLEQTIGGPLFYAGLLFFLFEIARYIWLKKMNWQWVGDSVTNFLTFTVFPYASWLLGATFLVNLYFHAHANWAPFHIPINIGTMILAVLLADFIYYWEHRFMHMTGIGWMTHTVHHSSPEFNISVAYRFGPLDGFYPLFFHFPLVLLGFHPLLVFAAEILVQSYQVILHTEAIPRLHRWIEAIFNTPSHHRVHHGSNPQYCDKNYAGILIIWDRIFGTFEPEQEKVIYGITKPLNSVNPLVVFLHGFPRLFAELKKSHSAGDFFGYLLKPPGWTPARTREMP